MDPEIQQSLQEIASLLLIVHDNYLKEVYGGEILSKLMDLLEDFGLQSKVSILDAERMRRRIMGNSEADMGYELFYDWLRGIGQLVSSDRDVAGKQALSYLLTHYIIPFAYSRANRNEAGEKAKISNLPYYTDAALKVIVDYDEFVVHYFFEIANQSPATSRSSNHTIWQQVVKSGKESIDLLGLVGSFTKYSIIPDIVTDDQVESLIMLASNSLASGEDALHMPAFIYALELVAEGSPDHKLKQQQGYASGGKMLGLLTILARNILRRRAFRVSHSIQTRTKSLADGEVEVFEDDSLSSRGITDQQVLLWMLDANAIQVPHVQIPLVLQFLDSFSELRADLLLNDGPGDRSWCARDISTVLFAVTKHLSTLTNPPSLSPEQEIRHLMKQLPGIFFGNFASGRPVNPALLSLYSTHTAPLLRDAVVEINIALHALWSVLRPEENCSHDADNFIGVFGRTHGKVKRILDFFVEAGVIPVVITTSALLNACSEMQSDYPLPDLEDANISQGCLFNVLYSLANEHWHALENLRLKRPLSSSPPQLSETSPEREEQIFQTFLYLLEFNFPFAKQQVVVPLLPAEILLDKSAKPSGSGPEHITKIPVPVRRSNDSLDHRNTSLQLESDNENSTSTPPRPSPSAFNQLAVSFNSNKAFDGSPLRSQRSFAPHLRSFFSEHPLRDIAVLLVHYPLSSFALNPWSILDLLQQNSAAFPPTGYGTPSANTDALLTALLSRFCVEFKVSSNQLSEFFAVYYLNDDRNAASSRKTSAALFKEKALRSSIVDFLMTEESVSLLKQQTDLLKLEYSRCFALYRVSSDPFAEAIITPFVTDEDIEERPTASLLPIAAVRAWALRRVGMQSEDVEEHIAQLACLIGLQSNSLTFSVFVLFATRCYCHELFKNSKMPSEEEFHNELNRMFEVFSQSQESLQQGFPLDIMETLYHPPIEGVLLTQSSHESLLEAALGQFNVTLASVMATPAPTGGSTPGDGRIPPRPPKLLWDAPRFVQFCRDMGILSKFNLSACTSFDAFGRFLRQIAAPGAGSWPESVVPPTPVRIGGLVLVSLSHTLTDLGKVSVPSCQKIILATLCSLSRHVEVAVGGKATTDGLRWEDLLRYGGSALQNTLTTKQDFLRRTYASLYNSIAPTVYSPGGLSVTSLQYRSTVSLVEANYGVEIPLTALCRFFACNGVLRTSAVAVQAKRSLHARLRPQLCSSGPRFIEMVTLSYLEFEELCVRCAFLLWETSTAHLHENHLSNRSVLLSQPHLQSGTNHTGVGSVGVAAASVLAIDAYVSFCERSSVIGGNKGSPAARNERGKVASWGVNFLDPFIDLLEMINQTVQPKEKSPSPIQQTFSDQVRKPRGSVTFGENTVMNVDPIDGDGNLVPESPSSSNRSETFLSVANDDIRLSQELPAKSASPTLVHASGINSRRGIPRPNTSSSSPQLIDGDGDTRALRDSSPSAKLQTSKRVILSSTERFLLRQESSEQFVVAVDALLAGTKEALWPVYATYCSCGDSLDPGKLSGPNLFTLLSKLGVLTDRTPLSDVGILLHQTAAHALTGPSANAVAMFYEGREYYESPSLTFEEFVVFLCAFSHLRYEGVMLTPEMFRKTLTVNSCSSNSKVVRQSSPAPDNWYRQWQEFMGSSNAFRHLLVECVLPILQKQMLLAFPEDARLRDRFCCVFSIEVLISIEGVEAPLMQFFANERQRELHDSKDKETNNSRMSSSSPVLPPSPRDEVEISAIITALKRINLIPNVMAESQVQQLIQDVLPEDASKRRGRSTSHGVAIPKTKHYLLFPQWEWVLSVVAFQAVEAAIQQSAEPTEPEKIPSMVADVITSIATAITSST